MKKELTIKKDYKYWIDNISSIFKRSQIKAATYVNNTMLRFYFCLGHDICKRMKDNKYGSSFYKKLSLDLRKELPDVHSFSETNLKYMVYFYKLYTNKNIDRFKGDLLMLPLDVTKLGDSNRPQLGDKLDSSNRQQVVDDLNNDEILPKVVEELNIPPFNIPWRHNVEIINEYKGNKK